MKCGEITDLIAFTLDNSNEIWNNCAKYVQVCPH